MWWHDMQSHTFQRINKPQIPVVVVLLKANFDQNTRHTEELIKSLLVFN